MRILGSESSGENSDKNFCSSLSFEPQLPNEDGTKSQVALVKTRVRSVYRDVDGGIDKERNDMLEKLKGQYPFMGQVFKRYDIETAGMPQWDDIQRSLTSEVLDKALKLESPVLIMVPPTTYESKIKAIDDNRMKGQRKTIIENQDPKLFNSSGTQWKVAIVEGVQNVKRDSEIDRLHDNDKKAKAWLKKYTEQGLDVIDDLDTYLTLAMKAFVAGIPIDTENVTILNAKRFEKEYPWSSPMTAYASWFARDNCLLLSGGMRVGWADGFQLRAVIWLDGF